jgi:toxin ParE1/3/4
MALEEFPERGMPRDDLVPGLRTLLLDRRITVAFMVARDQVDILRIFYAGRDYEGELRDRE